MQIKDVDYNKISPMMQQYLDIKKDYMDAILFYRLGDFYEMFFEDATLASRELELVLTGRNASLKERVPMCGVPHHAYLEYAEKLVERGYKVAICEQLEEPVKGQMVKRGVVEIITKGTLINEEEDALYIASLYIDLDISLAKIDVKTGDFFLKSFTNMDEALSFILKGDISEVIFNKEPHNNILLSLRNHDIYYSLYQKENDHYEDLCDDMPFNLKKASSILISYLEEAKKADLSFIKKAIYLKDEDIMQLDENALRNLELISNLKTGSKTNTLFAYLDEVTTAMGRRFLKRAILNPLRQKDAIIYRYDLIDKLNKEFIKKAELKKYLKEIYDLERLLSKVVMKRLYIKDILEIKKSIKNLGAIKTLAQSLGFKEEIVPLDTLYTYLDKALLDSAVNDFGKGLIYKKGFNKKLDEITSIKLSSKNYLLEIEKKEKEKTGIKALKIGFNKVFGYYIEVPRRESDKLINNSAYIRKQTLAGSERFITEELKIKENLILHAEEQIEALERALFEEIREAIYKEKEAIKTNDLSLSFMDFICALSDVALNNKLVRPKLNNNHLIDIKDSFHPVVERNTKSFVYNDILMEENKSILLITGPNMAGKSTFMRQLAIIAIMAQMGSFIPAKEAIIMLFDKIFTRIGASDDLSSGDSTFMTEMKEAKRAVDEATSESLILFDELGRGTSTYDGMAIAKSILEYMAIHKKSKLLFSTHYHELTSLEEELPCLKNVYTDILDQNNEITFLYKIRNGSLKKSYGIHVASLAGFKKEIIKRAEEILKELESKEMVQFKFNFEEHEEEKDLIRKQIKDFDLYNKTPLDALKFIEDLKKEI